MSPQTSAVILSLSAMIIIGVVRYVGTLHGIDSWVSVVAISAISGLGGYTLRHVVGLINLGKGK